MRCIRRWPRSTSRRTSRRRRSTPRSASSRAEPDNPRGLRMVYEAQKQLGNNAEADKALKELQSQKGAEVATCSSTRAPRRSSWAISTAPRALRGGAGGEARPSPGDQEALMIVYSRKNDWANAAAQAEKVLATDPQNLRALRVRHDAYKRLGDKAKEKEAFDALAKADPAALAGRSSTPASTSSTPTTPRARSPILDRWPSSSPIAPPRTTTSASATPTPTKPDLAKTHLSDSSSSRPAIPTRRARARCSSTSSEPAVTRLSARFAAQAKKRGDRSHPARKDVVAVRARKRQRYATARRSTCSRDRFTNRRLTSESNRCAERTPTRASPGVAMRLSTARPVPLHLSTDCVSRPCNVLVNPRMSVDGRLETWLEGMWRALLGAFHVHCIVLIPSR